MIEVLKILLFVFLFTRGESQPTCQDAVHGGLNDCQHRCLHLYERCVGRCDYSSEPHACALECAGHHVRCTDLPVCEEAAR